jgi:hypothetical protein
MKATNNNSTLSTPLVLSVQRCRKSSRGHIITCIRNSQLMTFNHQLEWMSMQSTSALEWQTIYIQTYSSDFLPHAIHQVITS